MPERVLQDTAHRRVVQVGDTVRRPLTPWSPSVHRLLLHLETVGFPYSPRFLGIDEQRREVLSFIPGTSGADGYLEGVERGGDSWANVAGTDGLRRFAAFLREYHDAVASFVPQSDDSWVTGRGSNDPAAIICHGDFGPWNVVWRADIPVGLIDWDFAHPGPAWDDVTYALRFVTPFVDDEQAVRYMRYPAPPDRARRIGEFLDAYGVPGLLVDGGVVGGVLVGGGVDEVVDDVVRRLIRTIDLIASLAADQREPQATWVAKGYLDRLREQESWIGLHRHLFQPP